MQLGHGGDNCPNPGDRRQKFVVCDLSGFHEVSLQYCDCIHPDNGTVLPQWVQLMHARWYPSSNIRPANAFTFEALSFFHELTLQGKTSLYDFHGTLNRITGNSGTVAGWVRHLACCIPCYR